MFTPMQLLQMTLTTTTDVDEIFARMRNALSATNGVAYANNEEIVKTNVFELAEEKREISKMILKVHSNNSCVIPSSDRNSHLYAENDYDEIGEYRISLLSFKFKEDIRTLTANLSTLYFRRLDI